VSGAENALRLEVALATLFWSNALLIRSAGTIAAPPTQMQRTKGANKDDGWKLVLRERIELSTSPLPRECSTTELPQPLMAGLLPYRTGKRKAKCNASVKGFAG
jgi:hypothetical protein